MKELFDESGVRSAALSHDFIEIESEGNISYGGSQNYYRTEREKKCGCGIVGAADVLLYMEAVKTGEFRFSLEKFLKLSEELRKKYIPIIPGRGVNAFLLAKGFNRYFKKNSMAYKAYWKVTSFNKWEIVEQMLKNDIPVIIAIGNNFPFVWGKKGLNLYVRDLHYTENEDVYKSEQTVNGHFVIITAIEKNCLTVSSWGRKYFINIDEFNKYVFRYSTHIYSNILVIEKK